MGFGLAAGGVGFFAVAVGATFLIGGAGSSSDESDESAGMTGFFGAWAGLATVGAPFAMGFGLAAGVLPDLASSLRAFSAISLIFPRAAMAPDLFKAAGLT